MKNIIRLIVLIIASILILSIAGCRKVKPNDNGHINGNTDKIEYSDIYKHKEEKAGVVTDGVYKASYGYVETMEQGYNCFWYRYVTDGIAADMSRSGNKWRGNSSSSEKGLLVSSVSESAQRRFTAPIAGSARVYGNPKLIKGQSARVEVSVGGEIIFERNIYDGIGVYHSDIVTLTEGTEVTFTVTGDAEVYWNPTVDYNGAAERNLHFAPDGYFGDVHPFYHDGKMYMYYLSTGKETDGASEIYSSKLAVSGDLIHYDKADLIMNPSNPPEQDLYFALGVYIDADGNFRSCYGKGNYVGGSVSRDLITWSNGAEPYIDENDGLLKYTYRAYFDRDVYSGRDPYIFYDKDSATYYCVVMNYYSSSEAGGAKGLALYTAGTDGKYSTKATKLLDFTRKGDPECPQLMKIGNRWYLFYSEYGGGAGGGVGRLSYRMGGENVLPQNVDWESAAEYSLDGGDLHAAQLVNVGDKLYMYGWLNYQAHTGVWGGYLNLPREVYQKDDGLLASRCDDYLTALLNKGEVAEFSDANTDIQNVTVSDNKFTSGGNGIVELDGDYGRSLVFADITLSQGADFAGLSVTQGQKTYYVGIVRKSGNVYLSISRDTVQLSSSFIRLNDSTHTSFSLKIVLDDSFIEAFVDGEYSVSANTALSSDNYNLGLILNGSGAAADCARVCKLADYYNIFD